ncbi:MAG: MerR family transcriptional regulator [Actinomycetota bacterium]|nr:MerR family transcriptional regulator [Actinomycetota bacterium]
MAERAADARTTMQIGEVAERTQLSLRTLRHYDEVGLLRPSARSEGGFRLYTDDDVEKLLVIRRMKPLGYSLEEMLEVMRMIEAPPAEQRTARLSELIDETTARREKLERQLAMADEFLDLLRDQLD